MIPPELLAKAIKKGTDEQYQAYVRTLPSVLTNDYREWVHGEGRSVYAHIRSVADGAGTGIKPPYSGVPLTQQQHANTHQYGEKYYNPSEWWQRRKIRILTNWINNVSPPQLEEKRTKATFTIESAEHMKAFQEMLVPYFANPKAKPVEITIQTGKKRSNKQNSSLWGIIYSDIVAFYQKNPIALGNDVVRYVMLYKPKETFIHELMKGLCNNNQSTASLKVAEHCNYFERVANWFMKHHNHEVKMPVNNRGLDNFIDD